MTPRNRLRRKRIDMKLEIESFEYQRIKTVLWFTQNMTNHRDSWFMMKLATCNEYLSIKGVVALHVYLHLLGCVCTDQDDEMFCMCEVKQVTIARRTRHSRSKISTAFKQLIDVGLIEKQVSENKRKTIYLLKAPSSMI